MTYNGWDAMKLTNKPTNLLMTLNCITWWGICSGNLEIVEYPFIANSPRFTLLVFP